MRNYNLSRISKPHAFCQACLVACLMLFINSAGAQKILEPRQVTVNTSPGFIYVEFADDSVTIKARDVTVDDLLKEIAEQSGLMLILHDPIDEPVTVDIQQLSLTKAISRILRNQNFALQYTGASFTGRLWVFSKGSRNAPGYGRGARHSAALTVDETIASLSLALANNDAQVRLEAVSGLTDIGNDQAAAVLAGALTDSDPRVREEAIYALGEIGGENAVPAIEQAFMDAEDDVRQAAIAALSDIGGDESARALAVALYDVNTSLREDAVYALGDIGGGTAIGLLQQALMDQEIAVRETAGEILAELSNQEL